jgi:signal peptidase II
MILRDPVPWLIGLLILGFDQLTKWLVVANLDRGESFPESGFFRLTHAWNTGAAFGLLQDYGGLLTWVSFGALFALFFLYRSIVRPPWYMRAVFGLLMGGAAGNLIDRLRIGHVTDFVDVGPFFIFNVADSAISVGIAIMFLYFWVDRRRITPEPTAPGDDREAITGGK